MSGVQNRAPLLFLTVLIIATAGLVYELLAGAIATTVLGNSLRQYSITIGVYLFAMGVGAYLSKFIEQRIAQRFVDIELAAALIGGTQGLLLYLAYGRADAFGVLWASHVSISTPLHLLAGLHVGAATPNFYVSEYPTSFDDSPLGKGLCTDSPTPVDGAIEITDAPGLGVTLDEGQVERLTALSERRTV